MDEVWPQIEHFLRNPKDFLKRYEMMLQEDGTTQRRKDTEAKFAKTELDIIKKKELHKNALRKELEGGDNSEAFKTIALDVLNEIRSLENLKNTLQSDLRTYEKREEAMNAVLARSKEYRGNLGKITDQQK